MPNIIRALSIAGFDGSGGAGMQADIKTFSALGCYTMSVLVALPVQNTTGVKKIYELPISCIEEQCKAIFEDIGVDVVKIGMLFNSDIIEIIRKILIKYHTKTVVLDPVMVAKSGHTLLKPDAIYALVEQLFPLCDVVTPNIPEASTIISKQITNEEMMFEAAVRISKMGPQAVVVKGGHTNSEWCKDILYYDNTKYEFTAKRIRTNNNHGTGCTFSAAIAAFLGKGDTIPNAVKNAKNYLNAALDSFKEHQIGYGHGPVNHFYNLF